MDETDEAAAYSTAEAPVNEEGDIPATKQAE